MSLTGQFGTDPERCDEYGYGLGRLDGIYLLKYRSAGALSLGADRQDFLHQLYWSPDGLLSAQHSSGTEFLGCDDAFWAHRGITHEVRAVERQTVYRVCLREVPNGLTGLRAGQVAMPPEAQRLIARIARPGCDEDAALHARRQIMDSLVRTVSSDRDGGQGTGRGGGYARTVARAVAHDPGDPTELTQWAERLCVSVKTLQRDFVREFGVPYTTWRTDLRLRAARVLLESYSVTEVAHRVGYATSSAFIAAFAKRYGHTPGSLTRRSPATP